MIERICRNQFWVSSIDECSRNSPPKCLQLQTSPQTPWITYPFWNVCPAWLTLKIYFANISASVDTRIYVSRLSLIRMVCTTVRIGFVKKYLVVVNITESIFFAERLFGGSEHRDSIAESVVRCPCPAAVQVTCRLSSQKAEICSTKKRRSLCSASPI